MLISWNFLKKYTEAIISQTTIPVCEENIVYIFKVISFQYYLSDYLKKYNAINFHWFISESEKIQRVREILKLLQHTKSANMRVVNQVICFLFSRKRLKQTRKN